MRKIYCLLYKIDKTDENHHLRLFSRRKKATEIYEKLIKEKFDTIKLYELHLDDGYWIITKESRIEIN